MKRILKHVGILTFSNTVNYGASLQACALRRAVESLGCDCEILNYSNRELDDRELGTHFSFSPSGAARYFLRRGFERRRVAAFSRFAETNLNLTSRLDRAALIDEAKTLDCILIGSDQVFNPRVNGHDPVFLGAGIADVSRVASYAASLGDATAEAITACDKGAAERLATFSGLSVREPSSMEVLRGMGLEPVFMPDPTLLLSCDDWSELATGEGLDSIPEKYVLLYTLNSEQKLLDGALEVAGRLGIPVVCLHYNTKDFPGVLNVRDVGPGAFLELVRRAAFVCTDSFHGACFSLNFNKQFVVKTSEAAVQSNVRITDLLARYGIEDCLYAAGDPSACNVDYDRANQVLDCDRANALSFIAECIGL